MVWACTPIGCPVVLVALHQIGQKPAEDRTNKKSQTAASSKTHRPTDFSTVFPLMPIEHHNKRQATNLNRRC